MCKGKLRELVCCSKSQTVALGFKLPFLRHIDPFQWFIILNSRFNAFTYITLNNWNLTLHKNGYSEYEQSTFLLLNYSLIIVLSVICLINYNTELFCQWIITVSVESAIHIPRICTPRVYCHGLDFFLMV